jgi:hypothetical protein
MESKTLLQMLGDQTPNPTSLVSVYQRLNRIGSAPDFKAFDLASTIEPAFAERPEIPLSGLILETRVHKNLDFIIALVQKRLGIPSLLVHGTDNRDFILKSRIIQRLIHEKKLVTRELPVGKITRSQYNSIFLSKALWQATIPSEKVLVFQTDAALCRLSPYRVKDFAEYDYVGSYRRNPRSIQATVHGGNGGLSLRSKAGMVAAIEIGAPKLWPGGEDDYFGAHLEVLGLSVARTAAQKRFCSQHLFAKPSFGVHNPGGISRLKFVLLLLYCPSALRCHRGSLFGVRMSTAW